MAPKKVEEPERKPLIGRVGTNLKIGIVGIPNVGKSTFFNVLTKSQAAAENFPFCTIDPNENKSPWKSGQGHVERLIAGASFIAEKNFAQFIRERPYHDRQTIPLHVPTSIIYPKANLYYAFAEDVHPMTRIATVSVFEKEKLIPHLVSSEESLTIRNSYLEDEVVNRYLKTDPPSFAIFGKPGLNSAEVASAIASTWDCILISPMSLIRQEIDSGTEKGRDMEKILQHGKCIGSEIVLDLIRCRIKMRDIKHRGYVVEGLPLIYNNMSSDHSSYSTHMFGTNHNIEYCENVQIHKDCITSYNHENLLDNLDCKAQIDYKREISRQINDIFIIWPKKPLIIIYIVCPKQDVVSERTRRHLTVVGRNIDENIFTMQLSDDNLGRNESDASFDFHQVTNEQSITYDDRSIYLLRRISDMRHNVEIQCDLYERLALPVIDKWILAHNPQHVIRVDGRSSAQRILRILNTRLYTLPLQPSILPKRMLRRNDIHNDEVITEIDMNDELAEKSAEEAFQVLRQRENVSPRFLWRLSRWKFYCPVELAQGRTIKGLSKYSVRFLNKIFFLSSQQAEDLFVENPRTFLLSPNPRSTCKIAVFGPKYAGKSKLSVRLAEVFDGTVINVNELVKELLKQQTLSGTMHEAKIDKNLSYDYALQDLEHPIPRLYENDSGVHISLGRIKSMHDEPIDISADEKADIIVQNIKKISDEKLEDELRRDGGYVVDGMYSDIEIWRKVVDEANIIFEDVVVLFESEPYAYLLDKFRGFFHLDDNTREVEYDTGIGHEGYEMLHQDFTEWEYLEYLKRFELEWTRFEEQLSEFGGNVIRCNLSDIRDACVAEYVINRLKDRFGAATTAMNVSEEDEDMEILKEATVIMENKMNLTNEKIEEDEEYSAYAIDFETAERLLDCGYYFLSSFGRWCPVQIYTNEILIQMFLPMKTQNRIFPVIYRYYIYFLAGEEALSAFLNDPSKYLVPNPCLPLIPLRISIIGPPRCGKTTLANRFAKKYGMKMITRNKALRHMLKYYDWTETARTTEDQLRAGRATSIESTIRAVEMFSMGARSATQGYILDDCPSNCKEAEQLALLGMYPMIVIDLKANLQFCLECLSLDNNDTKGSTDFSANFLSRHYANWQIHQASFRDWLKRFSHNVIELDVTKSKWNVWTNADRAVLSQFADITLYFREANIDKVHSLKYMCVSPFEFRLRQSRYESYCPVCSSCENTLKISSRSTDSQGMVQFREYFYWICSRHMDAFVKDPLRYLPPVSTMPLPDERPRILEETIDVKHVCWMRRLQVDGLCLVTYVEGLPDRKLMQGRADLAILFKDKVYLFCNEECREKFFAQHDKYTEVDITFSRELSSTEVQYLPDIDFLEQTVVKTIVEAVNLVATRRPKIFGLSAAVSAAIYIGVYLKTRKTVSQDLDEADIYEAVNKRIAGQNKIIKIAINTVKEKINPYVSLSKYFTAKVKEKQSLESSTSD